MRCVGIFNENFDSGEKKLDSQEKDCYFYRKHVSLAKPVGWDWDPVNQFEVIVAQRNENKVCFKKAFKKKINL